MNQWTARIDALDIGLFEAIQSQTSLRDRRSLLAVQRAVARSHGDYSYVEIGSHLGGSLQPHVADDRCSKIYSIDPRPAMQPDDRAPGYVAYYEDNSTERMLRLLAEAGFKNVDKIKCFDLDASEVDKGSIDQRPQLAFIDGEHTRKAAISDFGFCVDVVSDDAVVLFHDFFVIYPAVVEILKRLDGQGRRYTAVKLEDNVFGVFFDERVIAADPYLASLSAKNRRFLETYKYIGFAYLFKRWLGRSLPEPILSVLRKVQNAFSRPMS